jgi:hypothetical protein
MAEKKWGTGTKAQADRAASDKRDAVFFAERKARELANLAKTQKLKALRLAAEETRRVEEAANPKPVKKPARKTKPKRA